MPMPPLATRWESPAPVPANASWRPWGSSPAARRRSSSPAETFPTAACSVLYRPWQQNGLFRHLGTLPELSGYYMKFHVILLLAYMALCRIKIVEQLQYESPGELGKLMGLDRIPEVRCLRNKVSQLSQDEAPQLWAGTLSQEWMEQNPELAGTLYVDGHVRLYHGRLTKLPTRYVTRQRLCLRGTTDYWVNDALGQPFFSIERPIDHGMLEALQSDIVPRLLKDVPGQPTDEQLKADPYLSRFVIIFDREGYSPAFFRQMWQDHRIACITYHKYPKEAWPESWFTETEVTMPNGEVVSMKLAERGSWIGSRSEGLWVREVRKLTASGHQTSLISTAYGLLGLENAASLFSRWSQENFFRYMMEHFAIDALSEYRNGSDFWDQAAGGQPGQAGTGPAIPVRQEQADAASSSLCSPDASPASRRVGNHEMGARERRFAGRDRAVGARVDRLERTDAVHAQNIWSGTNCRKRRSSNVWRQAASD